MFTSQATWTKKYNKWVSEILSNIRENFVDEFVEYGQQCQACIKWNFKTNTVVVKLK